MIDDWTRSARTVRIRTVWMLETSTAEAADAAKSQGDRVVGLLLERLIERGNEVAVVGSDLETGESRSYPLATVLAYRPA